MIKREEKGIALAMLLAAAGLMIYAGYTGWRVFFIPLHYVGYVLAGIGVAGLLGVNIWFGPFAIKPDDDDTK